MKKYVIIGNGVAAVGCIEGIRSVDKAGSITVISKEPHTVYCRPLISYYLQGKTDTERMKYRTEAELEALGCTVLSGKTAVSVNKDAKTAALDGGEIIPYDALCVATGSSPWNPPFAGLDKVKAQYRFMTLDDTLALEQAVTPESRVMIVGAGLIGLKCAEGLHGRVADITVCDLAGRVLSSILDDECAAVVQKHLEANGIRFLLGDTVQSFEANSALMKSGKTVDFDVLVLTVGVRANVALIKEIGGEVNRGIITDEKQQTSIDCIYAAGDCTEGVDNSGNHRV
ncbi:MAG: FAD-dependent oxidoreductase, partial [Clostridia bacterium]|nr:FAD-dependent oxidoreductase [Clostridia bacterium]